MIIKRNEFTSLIENGLTKEEKKLLNNVAGLRPHFIVLLSLLVDYWCESWVNYTNHQEPSVQVSIEPYIPENIKQYYTDSSVNGKYHKLRWNFSKVPLHLIEQYCTELRKNMFQYIMEHKDAVNWDEIYLHKIIENILRITKLNIDDFS